MRRLAVVLALIAAPALAEAPMSGDAFEAYTTGKTLLYGYDGKTYGGEDYLPGRRVRWSFLDGRCLDGRWYEDGQAICFIYDDDPAPVCWVFFAGETGLGAELVGDGGGQSLYEIGAATEPLLCLGPEVGA